MKNMNYLKTTYVYKELINNYLLIGLLFSIFLIALNNIYFVFILIYLTIFLYKKNKIIVYIGYFLITIFLVHLIILNNLPKQEATEIIKVNDVIKYENYQKIIVIQKGKKNIIYDFDNLDIYPGNIIKVKLEKSEVLGERIEGAFDYQKYLKYQKVDYVYVLKDFKKIKDSYNYNILKYKLNEYVDNNFEKESRIFLKGLILGNKNDFTLDFEEDIKINSINHLFAISGLHVGIIILILKKLLSLLKMKKEDLYISIFLGVYLIITSFSPSIIRAVLMYYLTIINKKYKLMLSNSDIVSIIFLFLCIINPYYIYNIGFVLSFLVTIFIVLFSKIINNYNSVKQSLYITLFSNILTLPIVININNELNLLSPIINVIYIFLVSFIILPFSFLVFVFPFFKNIYQLIVKIFIKMLDISASYFSMVINIREFSKLSIFVFYMLLLGIIFFYYKRNIRRQMIMLLLSLVFINTLISPKLLKNEVVFFDLNEGESILINSKSEECLALIDTGTGENDEITNYFKRNGIKRLDYLILTHNHNDHNGEARKIINEINVNNIVVNAYDNSEFANLNKTRKVKSNDIINCGKIEMLVLNPNSNKNENDNSIVIHTKIGKYYFLFLGDISKEVEERISLYNLKVDCIKIAHHGSSTSTSPLLIERLKPKYAIIQSGRVKKFGFPSITTINTLNYYDVSILRTDLNYSIIYSFNKKRSYFKKTKP